MKNENRLFFAILPITVILILMAFSEASTLFLWIICSFFLFALIDPWMHRFKDKGINPIILAVILVLIATASLTGMGFLLYKTSSTIITQIISYKEAIFKMYDHVTHSISEFTSSFNPSQQGVDAADAANNAQAGAPAAATASSGLPNKEVGMGVLSGLNSVLSVLTFITLTPLLTFFMTAEREWFGTLSKKLLSHPGEGTKIWKQITDAITGFFFGNLVLILVSFPVFVLAFALLHVKSFVSLGLLSAIFNLVPFLGFVMAAILPTLDLFLNGGHITGALILVALCFITHFSVANVVTPKIIGARLNLNATVSTIALIGWGELWGPMGLLLAIPITAIIKIALEHSGMPAFQILAAMMSEDNDSSAQLRLKQKKT